MRCTTTTKRSSENDLWVLLECLGRILSTAPQPRPSSGGGRHNEGRVGFRSIRSWPGLCLGFVTQARHSEDIDLSYVIPLLFHGDDADSHRRRSFYICTLASPLCEFDCAWDSRILLACLDNSRTLAESYDVLDTWMVYSFTELQEGAFFTVNPWGDAFDRGKNWPLLWSLQGSAGRPERRREVHATDVETYNVLDL